MKRHKYYCRSPRTSITSRIRSCNSCARRKLRCDNLQPICSRCRTKAIECQYPSNTPKSALLNIQQGDDLPIQEREITPSLMPDSLNDENRQGTSYDGEITLDSERFTFDLDFANPGAEYLERNDQDIDFASFLNLQADEETIQYLSSGSSSLASSSTFSTNQAVQVQQPKSCHYASIPGAANLKVQSLSARSQMRSGSQRIADLIFHTLKSYPMMILRHKTLPPFIHPHLISSDIMTDNMESLKNCISLVHMSSSGFGENRKLFWKVVQLECEQLYKEVR